MFIRSFSWRSRKCCKRQSVAGFPGSIQPAGFLAANFPTDPADQSLIIDATNALLAAIAALNNLSAANVLTQVDAALDAANTEVIAVPASTASLRSMLKYLFAWRRNKKTQTATTMTLRNNADSADIATSAVSDDATTLTVAKDV